MRHPITLYSASFVPSIIIITRTDSAYTLRFITLQDKILSKGCKPPQVSDEYGAELERHALPLESTELESIHTKAYATALAKFDREKFGSEHGGGTGALR